MVENLHRQDLTPLEEAAAFQQLIEDFGLTHEQVADRIGKSRSAVSNTLRLLGLPPTVQHYLADGKLSAGHARALLGTPDRVLQEQLARLVVEEGWTVRTVEEAVRLGGVLPVPEHAAAGRDPAGNGTRSTVPALTPSTPIATARTARARGAARRPISTPASASTWAPNGARSPSNSPISRTSSASTARSPATPIEGPGEGYAQVCRTLWMNLRVTIEVPPRSTEARRPAELSA